MEPRSSLPPAIMPPHTPTKAALLAATGKTVPDVIAPGLKVLFCGINPGLYSAVVQHHFARPGNRFWPTLHAAGFTERVFAPSEEQDLLRSGYGITNLVERATATAEALAAYEFVAGRQRLAAKVRGYRPHVVAVLGVGAYRSAFRRPHAVVGRQPETLEAALLWVLPNPSGLNAHYQRGELARLFRALRMAVEKSQPQRGSTRSA